MCLAVPGKLIDTQEIGDSRLGTVQFGGIKRSVFLDFVPEAKTGDFVLVHVGFALNVLDEEEAKRTYELLEHIGMLETDDDPDIVAEDEGRISELSEASDAVH